MIYERQEKNFYYSIQSNMRSGIIFPSHPQFNQSQSYLKYALVAKLHDCNKPLP